jgi:hypothetical protein
MRNEPRDKIKTESDYRKMSDEELFEEVRAALNQSRNCEGMRNRDETRALGKVMAERGFGTKHNPFYRI